MFKIFTRDNLKLGLVLGFIAPFIGMYGYYFINFRQAAHNYWEFVRFLFWERHLLTNMLTFSLLANAIVFTIYVNTDRYKTAKGIFILTLVYAIPIIILKFLY